MLEASKRDIDSLYLYNCEFPKQSAQPALFVLHAHQCCNFSLLFVLSPVCFVFVGFWVVFGLFFFNYYLFLVFCLFFGFVFGIFVVDVGGFFVVLVFFFNIF